MGYVMTSAVCNIQYASETENTLHLRCRGHEISMRCNDYNLGAVHYTTYNHTIEDYLLYAVDIESNKDQKLRVEEAWMILLHTHN